MYDRITWCERKKGAGGEAGSQRKWENEQKTK